MASGNLPQVVAEEDARRRPPPRPILPLAAATLLPRADVRQPLQVPDVPVEAEGRP
jgi:hypothetical protein